jgi:zinc/manganese transport system permease protein
MNTQLLAAGTDTGVLHRIVNFSDYWELLALVHKSLIAGVVLGLLGGLVSTIVVMRDLAFAVHGISELSFAGGAAALLMGVSVAAGSIVGSLIAATAFGLLGVRARDRNSIIGIIMPFGLGLGVLFLALYKGRAANKFGLLTGQIVTVDAPQLAWLMATSAAVAIALVVMWRPLMFASLDPEVAEARGVPTRALSTIFMLVLGLTVALSVQIVGALLVLALLVTPAAAAMRVTASTSLVPLLSAAFGLTAVLGGILLALGGSLPISPYVTTISFTVYLVCRVFGRAQRVR